MPRGLVRASPIEARAGRTDKRAESISCVGFERAVTPSAGKPPCGYKSFELELPLLRGANLPYRRSVH
jgi:hypothetical protein